MKTVQILVVATLGVLSAGWQAQGSSELEWSGQRGDEPVREAHLSAKVKSVDWSFYRVEYLGQGVSGEITFSFPERDLNTGMTDLQPWRITLRERGQDYFFEGYEYKVARASVDTEREPPRISIELDVSDGIEQWRHVKLSAPLTVYEDDEAGGEYIAPKPRRSGGCDDDEAYYWSSVGAEVAVTSAVTGNSCVEESGCAWADTSEDEVRTGCEADAAPASASSRDITSRRLVSWIPWLAAFGALPLLKRRRRWR